MGMFFVIATLHNKQTCFDTLLFLYWKWSIYIYVRSWSILPAEVPSLLFGEDLICQCHAFWTKLLPRFE